MKLPSPQFTYDMANEAQTRSALEKADAQNAKFTSVFKKIYMEDTATGQIRTLVITSGGVVVT